MIDGCLTCGSDTPMARFENETEIVDYAGRSKPVTMLSGRRCTVCGEVIFDADSSIRYASAQDELVLADRRQQGVELRRIRKKLRLTQHNAAKLTGGGHNAFSRYERGDVPPMPAVVNLFRLLDRHPDLLRELQ